MTSKEDTTGLCSSSICAADLPVSRKAENFFIFSQALSLNHTDKDLLVRFLSLGNFQPLSHRPSCCPLSAPHSVLPLAHLGSEQVMLPRQVSLQSIFFKTETMILDQLHVFSLLDQQPHRTSFPFRFLTLLHPFLKRCFCSVSFSALHV